LGEGGQTKAADLPNGKTRGKGVGEGVKGRSAPILPGETWNGLVSRKAW